MNDYYEILGVSKNATQEEIKARYRFLVKAYHPDRFFDEESKSLAEVELKKINEAYSVLCNPEKRSGYDNIKNEAHTETSRNQYGDGDVYQRLQLIVSELKSIREKWKVFIPELEINHGLDNEIKELTAIFDSLYNWVFTPSADVFPHYQKLSIKLKEMMELNYYLGAEIQKNGLIKGFAQNEVDIASTISPHEIILPLINVAVQKKLLNNKSEEELYTFFFQKCSLINYKCRDLGAIEEQKMEIWRNPSNNKKYGSSDSYIKFTNDQIKDSQGYCQTCGKLSYTRKVIFRQNIGAFFRRFYKKLEGYLCADCVEMYYWQYSGVTLFFGWWGVISFVMTPVFLISNLYNYFLAFPIRKYGKNLLGQSVGWKLLTFLLIVSVIFLLGKDNLLRIFEKNQITMETVIATSTVFQARPSPRPTQLIKPTITSLFRPSPTLECVNASDVNKNRKGHYICVLGLVKSAYWGGQIFYITFNDDPDAFRLIVNNGYYYELSQGDCVMTEGIVEVYGSMPYIEIKDKLKNCS